MNDARHLPPALTYDQLNKMTGELGLDSRQRKLLKRIILENENASDYLKHFKDHPPLEHIWDSLGADVQHLLSLEFQVRDRESAPPYRAQGKRLKQIREKYKLNHKEFSEQLRSPLKDTPFPEQDIVYKPNRLRDMEYGSLPFDPKFAEILFIKFGVSSEWLLEGRGMPETKTGTLSAARISSAEDRLSRLESLVDINVGFAKMRELAAAKDQRVKIGENNTISMIYGTNAHLRIDIDEMMRRFDHQAQLIEHLGKRVESAENLLASQTELIKSYKEQIDAAKALAVALS